MFSTKTQESNYLKRFIEARDNPDLFGKNK